MSIDDWTSAGARTSGFAGAGWSAVDSDFFIERLAIKITSQTTIIPMMPTVSIVASPPT
jgi:hypothetical protein